MRTDGSPAYEGGIRWVPTTKHSGVWRPSAASLGLATKPQGKGREATMRMSAARNRTAGGSACLCVWALVLAMGVLCTRASADTIHDEPLHFTLKVPDGYIPFPA